MHIASRSLTSVIVTESPSNSQIIKRTISQPSLPNAPLPIPETPSRFSFQIIDLPNPQEQTLHEFQAQVLGQFGILLTPTQIVAFNLRCYHPSLRQYNKVYFATVGKPQYIVVSATSLNKDIKIPYPLPLKLGGYQVHTIPNIYIPRDRILFPGSQVDLINTSIHTVL